MFKKEILLILGLSFASIYCQQEEQTAQTELNQKKEQAVQEITTEQTQQEKETGAGQATDQELVLPAAPVMEEPVASTIQEDVKAPSIQEAPAIAREIFDIGLPIDARQKAATLLNTLLADEFILYVKTLQFHWNVQGIVFHDFHTMFKEQYSKLFEIIDAIAERARSLEAPALGSLQEFLQLTRLKETVDKKLSAKEMLEELLYSHQAIIKTLRADIDATEQLGDQGTSNFLQELIVEHEKIAWMLRAGLSE